MDFNIVQRFLRRCHKRRYTSELLCIQDILERQDRKLFYKFKNNACLSMYKEKVSPKGLIARCYVGPIIRNAHGLGWLVNALCYCVVSNSLWGLTLKFEMDDRFF